MADKSRYVVGNRLNKVNKWQVTLLKISEALRVGSVQEFCILKFNLQYQKRNDSIDFKDFQKPEVTETRESLFVAVCHRVRC
jgi:hypothetical protein